VRVQAYVYNQRTSSSVPNDACVTIERFDQTKPKWQMYFQTYTIILLRLYAHFHRMFLRDIISQYFLHIWRKIIIYNKEFQYKK
jgi:hypothetical protein